MTATHRSHPHQPTALGRTDSATTRIGTQGTQTRAFMAGIASTSIPGATQVVRVNSAGQLGTATAAQAAPLSASDGERLLDLLKRQQRQIERLRAQVKWRVLRAPAGGN